MTLPTNGRGCSIVRMLVEVSLCVLALGLLRIADMATATPEPSSSTTGDCDKDAPLCESTKTENLHPLFDGKYFKIITRNAQKVRVKCLLCNHELGAAVNATTNLYTYVKVST